MPKIHVAKSKLINVPTQKLYDIVSDLGTWTAWSPWLIMDPDATVKIAEDRAFYEWDGNRVGSGNLRRESGDGKSRVDFDLTFLKPWKSTAKTWMEIEADGKGSKISWFMDSSLPFFMFWMKKMMVTFVGMDYERGLNLLKDYAEDGEVHSRLEFTGESDYAGGPYIGIKKTIAMDEIETQMTDDFNRLSEWAADNSDNAKDLICIYHDFNPVKNRIAYTAAVVCKQMPETIPSGTVSGTQNAARVTSVTHVGPYHHLGNVWSTLHNMMRQKEFKPQKGYHPFELYENSPLDTAPNDLRTRVNFAVR